MCLRASLDLAPETRSAAAVRGWLREVCARWDLAELRDDLSLCASELVTNGVLHARTPLSVQLTLADRVVELAVADQDPRTPTLLPPRGDLVADIDGLLDACRDGDDPDPRHTSWVVGASGSVAAGRGLQLIAGVSQRWGVRPVAPHGKAVWVSVAVPSSWRSQAPCRCPDGQDRTSSGDPFLELPPPHHLVA